MPWADQALQAKGQIGFIDLFTLPLFQAASDIIPELQQYSDSCASNRALWTSRLASLQDNPNPNSSSPLVQPIISHASMDDRFHTLFPLSLPLSLVSLSYLDHSGPPPPFSTFPDSDFPAHPYSLGGPSGSHRTSSSTSLRTPPPSASYTFRSFPNSDPPNVNMMRAAVQANLSRMGKEKKGISIPTLHDFDGGRRASVPDTSIDIGRIDQQYLKT